jgi:dihydrolipoamide dehydrogenase
VVVGQMAEPVDLLVLGGGPGGYVAALRAAALGREVVLVERGGDEGGLGGSCLHVGCIPSKALIELAQARHRIDAMAVAGLHVRGATIDLGAFQEWKRALVGRLEGGIATLLAQSGVRQMTGVGRFTSARRAAVLVPDGSVQFLEFSQAIIATGSRPATVPGLVPDGERVLTSTGALALEALPESLTIVGAGYIGLELGAAFAKLGTKVTIVEALDRVLPSIDKSLTAPVVRRLAELGIDLHLSARVRGFADGTVAMDTPDGERTHAAERVVVAVGRVPNTDDIGLDVAGIAVDERGLIPVDERRLATPDVAAIGDVTAGPALAHKASAEGVVAAEALCGLPAAFDPMAIPSIAFTDPEVASAGLTADEARAAGIDVEVGTSPFAASGRAATLGEQAGFTRVVVDTAADRVVGVHVVGPHASELIAEGALAVETIASPRDVLGTIHPHPTLSESLHAAFERVEAARDPGAPTTKEQAHVGT